MGHGGARPGAGRPKGSIEGVPRTIDGLVPKIPGQYVMGMNHRVPPGTPKPLADVADYALARLVEVMTEKVDPEMAPTVMKAAGMLRDEICGPIVKKVEVKMGLAEMLALAAQEDGDVVDALPADGDVADVDLFPDPESRHEKALAPSSGPGPGAED